MYDYCTSPFHEKMTRNLSALVIPKMVREWRLMPTSEWVSFKCQSFHYYTQDSRNCLDSLHSPTPWLQVVFLSVSKNWGIRPFLITHHGNILYTSFESTMDKNTLSSPQLTTLNRPWLAYKGFSYDKIYNTEPYKKKPTHQKLWFQNSALYTQIPICLSISFF